VATRAPPETEHVARFALSLSGPDAPLDECGGTRGVEAAVEQRLHRQTFTDPATADVMLIVGLEARPGTREWSVNIVERDQSGTELGHRDVAIRADDCARGLETLAVLLAIMVGSPRLIPTPVAVPQPEPEPEPVPPAALLAPHMRTVDAAPRRASVARWTASPLTELSFGAGVLPAISWGLGAGVAIEPPVHNLFFLARAKYWPSQSTNGRPEGRFDELSGTLLVCRALRGTGGPSSFSLCAGIDAGFIHAQATDLDGPASGDRAIVEVPVEARLALHFGRGSSLALEPFAAAQVAASLLRVRFTYDDRAHHEVTLHEVSPLTAEGSIGLGVRFF
jgi:hypothetical protein